MNDECVVLGNKSILIIKKLIVISGVILKNYLRVYQLLVRCLIIR